MATGDAQRGAGAEKLMGNYAKFLMRVTSAKVVFLSAFWMATYFLPLPEQMVTAQERILAIALFLLVSAAGIFAIAYRQVNLGRASPALFAIDLLFALYLARFFTASHGLLLLLITVLIIFHTIVFSRLYGAITLLIGIILVSAVVKYSPADFSFLGGAAPQSEMLYSVLVLFLAYGMAFLVISHHRMIIAESDRLTENLADSTIASEIARGEVVLRNQQLSTLLLISESLSSSLEGDQLFKNFSSAIRNSVSFNNFSLLVFAPESRSFKVLVSKEHFYDLDEAPRFPIDRGIAGFVYNRGVPYVTGTAKKDPLLAELPVSSSGIGSVMCVPLFFKDEILGVLLLEDFEEDKYTSEQLRFVESIAPLLSIAVNNVLNYQVIKTASTRDKLTNLYNYFAFTQRFYELLESTYRKQKPLAFILIDLDDFKKVNDTYGHLAGNTVLAQMGDLLTSFFRRSDMVARYGGEEFAVVLPNTSVDIGLVIADSLREAVEESEFLGDGKPKLKLTISIGVSCTTDEGVEFVARPSRRLDDDHFVENLEEIAGKLIASADAALYESKRSGKNQVYAAANSLIPYKSFTVYRKQAPEGELPNVEKKPSWKLKQ